MTEHWQSVLHDKWAIHAGLKKLDGEYDLNFLVREPEGRSFVLKVMRPENSAALVDLQIEALTHLHDVQPAVRAPIVIKTVSGQSKALATDENGVERAVWLMSCLDGTTYAKSSRKTSNLIQNLGRQIGAMDRALETFDHPGLQRDFKWNLTTASWIRSELEIIKSPDRQMILAKIMDGFETVLPKLTALPEVAIHNDVNDHNVLVSKNDTLEPWVSGIVDFGDMCATPRICELGVAGAYVILDHPEPETALADLVSGYHAEHPLEADEIDLIWPLVQMRLAVSVVNSGIQAVSNPDDPYVVISEAPIWRFLENVSIHPQLMLARLRLACGMPVTREAINIQSYLESARGTFAPVIGKDLSQVPMLPLSVEESTLPKDPFNLAPEEAATFGLEPNGKEQMWLGYYGEPRLIYADAAFRAGPHKVSKRRTVHLGIDIFTPPGTPVRAPLAGSVLVADDRPGYLDYGGVVVLRHQTPNQDPFYTLFGHLDPGSLDNLTIGQEIDRGEIIATLGSVGNNGGWAPHLHFQFAVAVDGLDSAWPGVCDPDAFEFWKGICPNPASLLNLDDQKVNCHPLSNANVAQKRREHFGDNLRLSYREPVQFVRGWRHHLFDQWGRCFLDAYNNVPHVGHAHPRICSVAADQLSRINSNTRYLHPAQSDFAEKLLSKMPDGLSVCYFVNSGTEANELALRLARAHTGAKAMITPDHGYHGNTTGAIDISAYKFNAVGGTGKPDWVELVEVADDYRGSYRRDDPQRAEKFAALIDQAIGRLEQRGQAIAGFIAETFPSVGGQIIPPSGYLPLVYQKIRGAGGVCIADEVQTGLGRLGQHYFGFEHQDAVPDIVVLGKPIGNGHPLGVVVTTPGIAESFAKGPEFFSTFGGSTLSCRIGREVLDIVDSEGLMANAEVTGNQLLMQLTSLMQHHQLVGDVRGMGLFVGVDLVCDRDSRAPATAAASYVVNRLRQRRILIGTEGPGNNVLKIRPPLTIGSEDIKMLVDVLDATLGELS